MCTLSKTFTCAPLSNCMHTLFSLRVCLQTEKAKKIQFSEIVTPSITYLVTLRYRQSSQSTLWPYMPCPLFKMIFLQLMKKRNEKQNRLSDFVFTLGKKYITETKLFVAWHFHGQITSLWFLFNLWLWFQLPSGDRKPKCIIQRFISVAQH